MEDRYLFKAKRVDNGKWVIGYYGVIGKRNVIIEKYAENYYCPDTCESRHGNQIHEVNSKTICQCTGLKDKNGKLIWENDIVRFKHEKFDFDDGLESFERTCLPNKKEYKRNYVVEFCNTPTHYGLRFRNGSIWFMVHKMTIVMHDTEVIGNIFDNTESVRRNDE
jgi:uncharacterized phage protein (TIGR01671 family)